MSQSQVQRIRKPLKIVKTPLNCFIMLLFLTNIVTQCSSTSSAATLKRESKTKSLSTLPESESKSPQNLRSFKKPLIALNLEDLSEDDSGPGMYLMVLNKTQVKPWLESRVRSGSVTSAKNSMLFVYGRKKRQAAPAPPRPGGGGVPSPPRPGGGVPPPSGGGGGGGAGDGGGVGGLWTPQTYKKAPIYTPVLPIEGQKFFNDKECMPWDKIAIILRSGIDPYTKRDQIEEHTCNLKAGLECVPVPREDAATHQDPNELNTENVCRCLLSYGPKPVILENKNKTKECYVPAGLGWASECHNSSWESYGVPLPYGDPTGANAELAVQTDAYNQPTGETVVVAYIRWNSIHPPCVPNALCTEKGTYLGERCQCRGKIKVRRDKGHEGQCGNGAVRIIIQLTHFVLIMMLCGIKSLVL